jgi:hypothetical protein
MRTPYLLSVALGLLNRFLQMVQEEEGVSEPAVDCDSGKETYGVGNEISRSL